MSWLTPTGLWNSAGNLISYYSGMTGSSSSTASSERSGNESSATTTGPLAENQADEGLSSSDIEKKERENSEPIVEDLESPEQEKTIELNENKLEKAREFQKKAQECANPVERLNNERMAFKNFVKAIINGETDSRKEFSNWIKEIQWLNKNAAYTALKEIAFGKKNAAHDLMDEVDKGNVEAIEAMFDFDISKKIVGFGLLASDQYVYDFLDRQIKTCKDTSNSIWLQKVFIRGDKTIDLPKYYTEKRSAVLTLIAKSLPMSVGSVPSGSICFWHIGRQDSKYVDELRSMIRDQIMKRLEHISIPGVKANDILGIKADDIKFDARIIFPKEVLIYFGKDISRSGTPLANFFHVSYTRKYGNQEAETHSNCLVINEGNLKKFQELLS